MTLTTDRLRGCCTGCDPSVVRVDTAGPELDATQTFTGEPGSMVAMMRCPARTPSGPA